MGRKSKYPLLDDEKWLYEKYVKENLSTIQISLLVGGTPNSVYFRLKKFNISARNKSEARTNKRNSVFNFDKEIIEGSLLGDGSLKMKNKKSKDCVPCFRKTNIGYDHILYVANALCSDNGETHIKEWWNKQNRRYFHFSTQHEKELLPLFKEWYPENNNFKKLIPKNLKLTPKVILNWFMDDGTTSFRKRKTTQVKMTLCSESFTKEDNEWLCDKLKDEFNIQAHIQKIKDKGYGWRIFIPVKSINTFYDVIGPCPVPSMKYKWKITS